MTTPDDTPTPVDGERDASTWDAVLPKGLTWFGRVRRSQERRDDRADDRVAAANEREVAGLHRMIWAQWAAIALLLAVVVVLAGHAVGLEIPGVGTFTGGE